VSPETTDAGDAWQRVSSSQPLILIYQSYLGLFVLDEYVKFEG
jgi:hypothetical protein